MDTPHDPSATPSANVPPRAGQPTDRLLEHEYDGIREYDNPMPRWWLLTFAATVVFSAIYLLNVGPIGNGRGRIADYEADMKTFAATHAPTAGGGASPQELLALARNHEALEQGAEIFKGNCAPCHRADAGGLIGPNLTDDYWLHGGTLPQIYATVNNGVLEKGMPAWGKMLKPKQVESVAAYVASMRGSKPLNPKAPQGTLEKP